MLKLLDPGGYGCVYHDTGVKCGGTLDHDKSTLTKLQNYSPTVLNEIFIGKQILKIPNYLLHFAPIFESCVLKDTSRLFQDDCAAVKKKGRVVLTKVNYINAITLSDFVNSNITIKKSKHNRVLLDLIYIHYGMINNIDKLINSGIIHLDIKMDNILIKNQTKTPILIDFGSSFQPAAKPTDWLRIFYVYAPDYYVWPFEVHVLCYCLHTYKKGEQVPNQYEQDTILNMIATKFVNNNPIFDKKDINTDIEKCVAYGKTLFNNVRDFQTIYDRVFAHHATWDCYGASIASLLSIRHLYDEHDQDDERQNILLNIFFALLHECLEIDPNKRLRHRKLLSMLNSLVAHDQQAIITRKNEYS